MGEPSVDSEGGTPIPHQRFIPQWGKHSIGPICSVPAIRPSRRTAPVPLCAMLLQAGMLEKSPLLPSWGRRPWEARMASAEGNVRHHQGIPHEL